MTRTTEPGSTKRAATKSELREEIRQLRSVGSQMSNVCFNIGQRHDAIAPFGSKKVIDNFDLGLMAELRVKWDAIKRTEPNV